MKHELSAAVARIRNSSGYVAAQVFGNAALLGAAAAWLWIPEAHTWQLAFSFVTAAVLIVAFVWLHAATMARWNQSGAQTVQSIRFASQPAWKRALLNLPAFGLWMVVAIAALWVVQSFTVKAALYAGYLSSRPPAFARSWLSYGHLLASFHFISSALTWYVLPTLLLPLACEAASRGLRFTRYSRCADVLRNWKWWLIQILVVAVGVWLPMRLAGWNPDPMQGASVRRQVFHVVVRLGLAYLLAVMAWMASLAFVSALLSGRSGSDGRILVPERRRDAFISPRAKADEEWPTEGRDTTVEDEERIRDTEDSAQSDDDGDGQADL